MEDEMDKKCQPCEGRKISKPSDGLCIKCAEHMCKKCFDTHKQFKLNRTHTLTETFGSKMKKEPVEDLESCKIHKNKLVILYCQQHEKIGCGDCMVLDHKTCKVENIRDKARSLKESKEFQSLVNETKECLAQAESIAASIKNNKKQADDIYKRFVDDVDKFSDVVISRINTLKTWVKWQAKTAKSKDIENMTSLETENEEITKELLRMTELPKLQTNQPSKLIVNYISQKQRMKEFQENQERIRKRNMVKFYTFKPEEKVENTVRDFKRIGSLQESFQEKEEEKYESVSQKNSRSNSNAKEVQTVTQSDDKINTVEEPKISTAVRPKNSRSNSNAKEVQTVTQSDDKINTVEEPKISTAVRPKPFPRWMKVCRNIEVDGEYLSYADKGQGHVGLFVFKNIDLIEIEIVSTGECGDIAVGLVPDGYPKDQQPGLGKGSIGYHADGKLFHENGSGRQFGPKCTVGDSLGCLLQKELHWYIVKFIRNGKQFENTLRLPADKPLFPAVGLQSHGERVKVISIELRSNLRLE